MRRKNSTSSKPADGTPSQASPPRFVEYTPELSSVVWSVDDFAGLAAEFNLSNAERGTRNAEQAAVGWPERMVAFHGFVAQFPKQWLLVRRLFNVGPVIPEDGTPADELRAWSRKELCERQGLSPAELSAHLAALSEEWSKQTRNGERGTRSVEDMNGRSDRTDQIDRTGRTNENAERGGDAALLLRHGFPQRMFEVTVRDPVSKSPAKRPEEENAEERRWFCSRLAEMEPMFLEPKSESVAREALMTSLHLRRLGQEMALVMPGETAFKELLNKKTQLEESLGGLSSRLEAMFPEEAVSSKVTFRHVVSDLVVAVRDWQGMDTRLADGMSTQAELEFLLRRSIQVDTRYRPSIAAAVNDAMRGLYDPKWKSTVKPAVWKAMDEAWRSAAKVVLDREKVPVIDLENGILPGEGEDFEDFGMKNGE